MDKMLYVEADDCAGVEGVEVLCTRAALWAAIGDLESAAVEDAMTGDDDALVQARAQVRALLGMEAE